jgi:proteasome lid subunit RPN8/RPN11
MALFSCYSGLARQDVLFLQVDSIGTSRNKSSGNCCKTVSAIQRSVQNLWPFSAVILVWRDKTSSSPSWDSNSTSRKTASENYCKTLSEIQRSDQKFWPLSAVILVWHDKTSYSTKLIA